VSTPAVARVTNLGHRVRMYVQRDLITDTFGPRERCHAL
jgi:hypothetical protein